MKILYIPDYDSSYEPNENHEKDVHMRLKRSWDIYYQELKKFHPRTWINTIYADLSTIAPSQLILKQVKNGPYDLIVGNGFGGVHAAILGRTFGCRTILINPLYPIYKYIDAVIPEYPFKEELEEFEFKTICNDASRKSLENIFLILDEYDDVADVRRTQNYFYWNNSIYVNSIEHQAQNEPEDNPGFSLTDTFSAILGELATNLEKSPSEIREKIELLRKQKIIDPKPLQEKIARKSEEQNKKEMEARTIHLHPKYIYRPIRIHSLDADNGNFAITWSYADSRSTRRMTLNLFYNEGTWFWHGAPSHHVAADVLKEAALPFIEAAEHRESPTASQFNWLNFF